MNALGWEILQVLPESVIFVDAEHAIQFMNPAAADLFEVPNIDDVIGTAFKLLPGGTGLMTHEERIESTTNPVLSQKPNDEQIWIGGPENKFFRFHAIPVYDDKKKGLSFVIRVDDTTKERLASEYLACLSSDITTPITSIRGFAEILSTDEKSGNLTEEQKKFVGIIKKNALMLLQMRDSISEFFIQFR